MSQDQVTSKTSFSYFPGKLMRVLVFGFGILILGFISLYFHNQLGHWLGDFRDLVKCQGAWGALLFALVYVSCTLLFVPGLILTIAAGAFYGPIWGTLLVSISSTIGASLAFLVCRYLARDWVHRVASNYPKFSAVDKAIAQNGGRIVILLRLSPVLPFNVLNYGLGLTGVRFRTYLLASWLGMLPGTFAYVLVGSATQEVLTGGQKTVYWIIGGVITMAAIIVISRVASHAIREVSKA